MRRIRLPLNRKWTIALHILGALILFSAYETLSVRQHAINPADTTLPNLRQLAGGIIQIGTPRTNVFQPDSNSGLLEKITSTWIYRDVIATYIRLSLGLLLGCILSTLIGIWMGCRPWMAALFDPAFSFLAKVPGTAMLAVFFVTVGTGESMFITMIAFGILPTLTKSIYLSARDDVYDEEINKAYSLDASNPEVIWTVVFPAILPKVISNVALQIGPAMVYLIAAEMLTADVGMGYQIRMQQRLLNMPVVYVYILLLGFSGLFFDWLLDKLIDFLCPWYEKTK